MFVGKGNPLFDFIVGLNESNMLTEVKSFLQFENTLLQTAFSAILPTGQRHETLFRRCYGVKKKSSVIGRLGLISLGPNYRLLCKAGFLLGDLLSSKLLVDPLLCN